jgi:hypothetical protein
MAIEKKSKLFADLVVSMSDVERLEMAHDILGAVHSDGSIPAKMFSATEIKRVANELLALAHEIDTHHPEGTSW